VAVGVGVTVMVGVIVLAGVAVWVAVGAFVGVREGVTVGVRDGVCVAVAVGAPGSETEKIRSSWSSLTPEVQGCGAAELRGMNIARTACVVPAGSV
jgi:hypothetical protein